jgi:hypothetical protein
VGANDAAQAIRLVAPLLPAGTDYAVAVEIVEWVATLYQDGERYWSGLQPDPLAEYLIGTTLGPTGRCPP